MERKKLSPIEKHSARVINMTVVMILFWWVIFLIILVLMEIIHAPEWLKLNNISLDISLALFFSVYVMWRTNVRFGFVENIIDRKKTHSQLSVWFEKVTGK